MLIEPKLVYRYKGKDYTDPAKIREQVENQIGAIIDLADVTLTPKQKLNLLSAITTNKSLLITLLDIHICEDWQTSYNVLDIKD